MSESASSLLLGSDNEAVFYYHANDPDGASITTSGSTIASETSSSSSWRSESDTIWGPGALSGKAIMAVGQAILDGVENVVVRTRLRSISKLFPHQNDVLIPNAIYDDLLELSRVSMYNSTIRGLSLAMILVQVATGQTEQLVGRIARWPSVEIRSFVSELMLSLFPLLTLSPKVPTKMHRHLRGVYFSHMPTTYHEPGPFESFMNQVASHSPDGCPSRSVLRLTTLHARLPTQRLPRLRKRLLSEVTSVTFSPDGTKLLFSSYSKPPDAETYIEDMTGTVTTKLFPGSRMAAFSPDGSHIACMGQMGVDIWDTQTREKVRNLSLMPPRSWRDRHRYIAYSPDGARIATGSTGKIAVWDAITGNLVVGPIERHRDAGSPVAFSPNGQYITSFDAQKSIYIWNAKDGALIACLLSEHTDYIHSVAFSPDGKWIASGSWDKTVRIIDVTAAISNIPERDGSTRDLPLAESLVPGVSRCLRGHTSSVFCVAFSSDGEWIMSGSRDGTVRIWHFETGDAVVVLPKNYRDWATSLAMTPSGDRIAVGLSSGSVEIWSRI